MLFFPSIVSPSLLSCPNVETVVTQHSCSRHTRKLGEEWPFLPVHSKPLAYKIVIVSGRWGETDGAISRLIYYSSNSETRPTAASSFLQTQMYKLTRTALAITPPCSLIHILQRTNFWFVVALSVLFVRYCFFVKKRTKRDKLLELPGISLEEFYVLGEGVTLVTELRSFG